MKVYKLFDFVHRFYNRLVKEIYTLSLKSSFKSLAGKLEPLHKLEGAEYISIGKGTVIGRHSILTAWETQKNEMSPSIYIGKNTNINDYNHISAINRITIGDDVLTGRYVLISDNSHGQFLSSQLNDNPLSRPLYSKGPIVIGNNVWIGEHVCILGGVTIGDGCVIAANSVVTRDVPPYCLVAGVPAVIKKQVANNEDCN